MSFKRQLIKINACQDAIDWVGNRTVEQAWNDCHRGDWMLWLLEKMEEKEGWLDEKEIMLLGCWCARRALKYVPEKEIRPLKAIEAKEKWARGEITKEKMNAVREVAAKAATWSAVSSTIASVTASDAARATASDAVRNAVKNAANTVANATWFAAYNKEFLNQADYIRAQFTPPV